METEIVIPTTPQKMLYTQPELDLFSIPLPEATISYSPISHKQILDTVYEKLDKTHFNISHRKLWVNNEGLKVAGQLALTHKDFNPTDIGLQLLWQNSYDKSLPAKVAVGAIVFICSNGMVRSNQLGFIKRKHTGSAIESFQYLLNNGLGQIFDVYENLVKDADRMKEIQVDKRTAAELAGRMFMEEEIITSTQLNVLKNQVEASDHFAFAEDGVGTVWQLYNNTTEALKKSHATDYIQSHIDVHQFFTKEYAF